MIGHRVGHRKAVGGKERGGVEVALVVAPYTSPHQATHLSGTRKGTNKHKKP